MKKPLCSLVLLTSTAVSLWAQPGLTIYNGSFAVVRDTVSLDLKPGENSVRYSGATASLEPSSVILRDPKGQVALSILEQNYRNDPVSEFSLLDRFEDQVISFLIREPNKEDRTVEGKVVRSGYNPRGEQSQPIIEVGGKLSFELPGRPLFPALKDDNILKPTLSWKIQSTTGGKLDAELAYLTGGLEWNASYNIVLPEQGDNGEMNGWVTIKNRSGKVFEEASIKLLAGDVNRAAPPAAVRGMMLKAEAMPMMADFEPVKEKAFDDFHLYQLPRPTTLRDQETKQVEFARSPAVPTKRVYVYDGAGNTGFGGAPILDRNWGAQSANKKVESSLEFKNDETAKLGIPLPAGTVRVYRKDGSQLEFVGEDRIDHIPRNERVRLKLGNAFDLVGERKRTDFKLDNARRELDETFEIRVRNQSARPAVVQVREHLSRASSWTISQKSAEFQKLDSHSIEFPTTIAPQGEAVVTYTVHYTW